MTLADPPHRSGIFHFFLKKFFEPFPKLHQISKANNTNSSKWNFLHCDFLQTEIQHIQHVCFDHAHLIYYHQLEVLKLNTSFIPHFVTHRFELVVKAEAKCCIQGLTLNQNWNKYLISVIWYLNKVWGLIFVYFNFFPLK